jgi:hypothetical protein
VAEGAAQVVPALVTGMLRATIRGGEAVTAWTTVPPMPSQEAAVLLPGVAWSAHFGGTDGPQVTFAPAGTSAKSSHGPT